MGRIIEAKAVISGEDRLSKVLDGLDRKLKNVGKNATISKEIDRMSRSLKGARDGLKAIDDYRGQRNGFFDARNRMRETKAAVDQAARALAGASKPTRALEQNMRQAQRAADAATAAFERQKAAVLNSRAVLTKGGVAVSSLISEQGRLGKSIDQTTAAMARQVRHEQRTAGLKDYTRARRVEREMQRVDDARRLEEARAGASGSMLRGMGGAGRRQADSIEANRRLIEGMGAPSRQQAAQRQQLSEASSSWRRATRGAPRCGPDARRRRGDLSRPQGHGRHARHAPHLSRVR